MSDEAGRGKLAKEDALFNEARLSQLRADQAERDEPPPFFGTWGRVYALVILYLGLLIAALYGMTWAFAP
ncbi:MAG: hypothetical protein WBW33_35970 [Bryobacteraceae bacterium]